MPRGLWATVDHQLAEAEAEAGSSRIPLSDRFRIDSEMPVHMRTCTHTGNGAERPVINNQQPNKPRPDTGLGPRAGVAPGSILPVV